MPIKISFFALHELDKYNIIINFQGIGSGLYYFASFFDYQCLLVKGQLQNLGDCSL